MEFKWHQGIFWIGESHASFGLSMPKTKYIKVGSHGAMASIHGIHWYPSGYSDGAAVLP